jgi:hypothetical protein
VTEADWTHSSDILALLESLKGKVSGRRFKLFAASCARRVFPLLPDPRLRRLVEVFEKEADDLLTAQAIDAACRAVKGHGFRHAAGPALTAVRELRVWLMKRERQVWHHRMAQTVAQHACAAAAYGALCALGYAGGQIDASFKRVWLAAEAEERAAQCHLLRCVMGNPFRPLMVDPSLLSWNEGRVVRLADSAYRERLLPEGHLDPVCLGVLADAIEDSGAADELVAHLRSPGPHVVGCASVDALLGKS